MIELKNAVYSARIKLGLSNSELSKLIGHSRNYITESLRVGVSTEKQAEIINKINEAVEVELVSRGIGNDREIEHLNREIEVLVNQLATIKREMKLQEKVINWLAASNVLLGLALVVKYAGWV